MKRKSLAKSILASSMATLAAALIAVCLIFSVNVHIQYKASIESNLYHTVAVESAKMETWFAKHMVIAEDFAKAAVLHDLHGEALKQHMLDVVHPASGSIMNGYLSWESEPSGMMGSVYPFPDDFPAHERGWYKAAKSARETIVTDPYIDAATGKIVITVASPLLSGNEVLGVCGLDIEIDELVTVCGELKADKGGYAVLIDGSDNIVAHAQNQEYSHRMEGSEEKVTKLTDMGEIYGKVLSTVDSEEVISGTGTDGKTRCFPIVPIGDTGWKVLYAADYNEAMLPLVNVIILAIIVSVAMILIGGAFFYLKFTKRLKPLSSIENIVTEMSNGVLEHNYPKASNDEIGTICEALKKTNKSLKSYINGIERILSDMADGKFSYDGSLEFVGEFTAMEQSIKHICEAMNKTFSDLNTVSEQIADGSHSVSSGTAALAHAVNDETKLIGDVSKSLEDISSRVSKSAENAFEVKEKAVKASDTIDKGNEKMRELVEIMDSISRSADEIVKINSTIEDIAFQTNILALNASIEAARAGAAGKGFAVVAEEVRNLAAKSGEASKTTAELIGNTVKAIESGTAAANSAAEMLGEIVDETSLIGSSVSEIADVSEEQKTMISDISAKLGEVETVIGQTDDAAQNSAAASEELDSQAVLLKEHLCRFR